MTFWNQFPEDRLLVDAFLWSSDFTVPDINSAGAQLISPGSLIFTSKDLDKTKRWLHGVKASRGGLIC